MDTTASRKSGAEGTKTPWQGFRTGLWQKEINVQDFIQQNYDMVRPRDSVDVLPFHRMGRFQRKQLGMGYTLNEVETPLARSRRAGVRDIEIGGVTDLLMRGGRS